MYTGGPSFKTEAYNGGHIHYRIHGGETDITVQWTAPDGKVRTHPVKSEHAARCYLSRRRSEKLRILAIRAKNR